MTTSTARLGLLKKGNGEQVDVVTDLAENFDKIDAAMNGTVCTSGTRPATPWTGQIIHETDTKTLQVWDGSAWVKFAEFAVSNTGWQNAGSVNAGWDDATSVQSRRINGRVQLRGVLDPDGGSGAAAGTYVNICMLVSGHRPPTGKTYRFPVVTEVDGATPYTLRPRGVVYISDNGYVSLQVEESTSRAYLDGISFFVD